MNRTAAIFDLDGVLVDSWAVAKHALSCALADLGHAGEVPLLGFSERLGKPLPIILNELNLPLAAEPLFNRYALAMASDVRRFADVAESLARLRHAGVTVGIITGKSRQRAISVLEHTALASAVDALITPDDAPGKPNPRALWQCLRTLNADRAACFVGDSMADSQMARAASTPAAFAAWGSLTRYIPGCWDIRFETPDEMTSWILDEAVW